MLSQKIPFGGNQFPSNLRDLLANPERETPKWGGGGGHPAAACAGRRNWCVENFLRKICFIVKKVYTK